MILGRSNPKQPMRRTSMAPSSPTNNAFRRPIGRGLGSMPINASTGPAEIFKPSGPFVPANRSQTFAPPEPIMKRQQGPLPSEPINRGPIFDRRPLPSEEISKTGPVNRGPIFEDAAPPVLYQDNPRELPIGPIAETFIPPDTGGFVPDIFRTMPVDSPIARKRQQMLR